MPLVPTTVALATLRSEYLAAANAGRRPDSLYFDGAVRVVVAEDLFLVRDGLVRLVEAHGHSVIAVVETGPDALDALVGLRPDGAILDVRLPPTFTDEGVQADLAPRREIPGLPVLILSQHVEQLYARELLADSQGGIGYQLNHLNGRGPYWL